jgi:hypothetical protein
MARRLATVRSGGTRTAPSTSVVSFTPNETTSRLSQPATQRAAVSAGSRLRTSSLVSRRTPRL